MSIRAVLAAKVSGDLPSEEQLQAWSQALIGEFGDGHFFAQAGLSPEAWQAACREWEAAGCVEGQYPGDCRYLAIDLTGNPYGFHEHEDLPSHHRDPGMCLPHGRGTALAEPGSFFLRVNLLSRYYGPGCKQGDIRTIAAIAVWIEVNIPGAEVWYGGDSSNVAATPWPHSDRQAALDAFRGRRKKAA